MFSDDCRRGGGWAISGKTSLERAFARINGFDKSSSGQRSNSTASRIAGYLRFHWLRITSSSSTTSVLSSLTSHSVWPQLPLPPRNFIYASFPPPDVFASLLWRFALSKVYHKARKQQGSVPDVAVFPGRYAMAFEAFRIEYSTQSSFLVLLTTFRATLTSALF